MYVGCCAITIIHQRLRHYDASISVKHAETVTCRLARVGSQLTPAIHSSVLRTICNAWCTSARFQENVLHCRFCGERESDSLRHYLSCKSSYAALTELLPFGIFRHRSDGLAQLGVFAAELDEQHVLINATMADAFLWAFKPQPYAIHSGGCWQ